MPTEETGIYHTFFTLLTVLSVMVTFYVVSVYRQQKRRLHEIKDQLIRDMALIENERKRIAKDLHDDLGSGLGSVKGKLLNIMEELPGNKMLPTTVDYISSTIIKLKEIAHDLMPTILSEQGLCAAIADLVDDLTATSPINIHFNNDCDDSAFDPVRSIMVFRVIQEILSNAIKHSGANQIIITFSAGQKEVTLEIKDDGKGFDQRGVKSARKHLGLRNINSRLALLDAVYKVLSEPGKGTYYHITIPVLSMIKLYE